MVITQKRSVGNLGEDISCQFLRKKGFVIKDRNYLKKYGEIDVVAIKDRKIHFIEVKSVLRHRKNVQNNKSEYLPEENIHHWKIKRLSRTIESYLLDKKKKIKGGLESDWQFDVIVVFIFSEEKTAEVKFLQNIMLV